MLVRRSFTYHHSLVVLLCSIAAAPGAGLYVRAPGVVREVGGSHVDASIPDGATARGGRLARVPAQRKDSIGYDVDDDDGVFDDAGEELSAALVAEDNFPDLRLVEWYGRLGNRIIQLANAILLGKHMNKRKLVLPSNSSSWCSSCFYSSCLPLFDLPEEIAIQRYFDANFSCSRMSDMSRKEPHGQFFGVCENVDKQLVRNVLFRHLMPYLTPSARTACDAESADPFRGLTIHLRSGDVMRKSVVSHTMYGVVAPCGFFEKVVSDYGFHAVRIVTESDRSHPCISVLQDRFGGPASPIRLEIQSGSLEQDACAVMHATHLAIGSHSTFSQALELLSTELQVVFQPVPADRSVPHPTSPQKKCVPLVESNSTGRVGTRTYKISGMRNINDIPNRTLYFEDFPLANVTLAQTCLEEAETAFQL